MFYDLLSNACLELSILVVDNLNEVLSNICMDEEERCGGSWDYKIVD